MSLDEVKVKTSASQFVLWQEFFDWEINAFDKYCYYLAQVSADLRRPYMPKGKTVSVDDCLIKFTTKQKGESPLSKMQRMKQAFFGMTGLIGKGKKKGKK